MWLSLILWLGIVSRGAPVKTTQLHAARLNHTSAIHPKSRDQNSSHVHTTTQFRALALRQTPLTLVLINDVLYYQQVIAELGAEFRGMQQGPRETLILLADPQTAQHLGGNRA